MNTDRCNSKPADLIEKDERAFLSDPACPLVATHDVQTMIEEHIADAADHPCHIEALDLAIGHLMHANDWRKLQERKALGVLKFSPLAASACVEPLHSTGLKTPVWAKGHVLALYRAARFWLMGAEFAALHCTGTERGERLYAARRRWNADVERIQSASADAGMQILLTAVSAENRRRTEAWKRSLASHHAANRPAAQRTADSDTGGWPRFSDAACGVSA